MTCRRNRIKVLNASLCEHATGKWSTKFTFTHLNGRDFPLPLPESWHYARSSHLLQQRDTDARFLRLLCLYWFSCQFEDREGADEPKDVRSTSSSSSPSMQAIMFCGLGKAFSTAEVVAAVDEGGATEVRAEEDVAEEVSSVVDDASTDPHSSSATWATRSSLSCISHWVRLMRASMTWKERAVGR